MFLHPNPENKYHYFGQGLIVKTRNNFHFVGSIEKSLILCCNNKTRKQLICESKDGHLDDFKIKFHKLIDGLVSREILVENEDTVCANLSLTGVECRYYPFSIYLEITDSCNLSCSHCYKNASEVSTQSHFLAYESVESLIKQCSGKINHLVITGGEPTIHPQIIRILQCCFDYGVSVDLITNGIMLANMPDYIISKLNSIKISYYGYDSSSYCLITSSGHGHNYQRMRDSIIRVFQLSSNAIVGITLNTIFCKNLDKIMDDLVSCGVTRLELGRPVLAGRAVSDDKNIWSPVASRNLKSMEFISSIIEKYDSIDIRIVGYQNEPSNVDSIIDCNGLPYCGYDKLVISPEGVIRPCLNIPDEFSSLGNIENFEDICSTGIRYSFVLLKKYVNSLEKNQIPVVLCPLLKHIANL